MIRSRYGQCLSAEYGKRCCESHDGSVRLVIRVTKTIIHASFGDARAENPAHLAGGHWHGRDLPAPGA